MTDGPVFRVAADGPDAAEREARAALPEHLYLTDAGTIGCHECDADPQLRPVDHADGCPHSDQEGSP